MLCSRHRLLQVYADWLTDHRSRPTVNTATVMPILGRLDAALPPDGAEVFIDARQEDALLALSALQTKCFMADCWGSLFGYVQHYARWRCLGSKDGLLRAILLALLQEDGSGQLLSLLMEHVGQMGDSASSLAFCCVAFEAACELAERSAIRCALTERIVDILLDEPRRWVLLQSPQTLPCLRLMVRSLQPDVACSEQYSLLIGMSAQIASVVKPKSMPSRSLVELFVETVGKAEQVAEFVPRDQLCTDFARAFVTELPRFTSTGTFGRMLAPVIGLIAKSLPPDQSLPLLHHIRGTVDQLAAVDLSAAPEYEQIAQLYGQLIGQLAANCWASERPQVVDYIKGFKVHLPEQPRPSDTVTGGLHLRCPTALPIFGAVCRVVQDADLATHCFGLVSRCFEQGPYGQRARIFYDQMIAIATSCAGSNKLLNATLDILCKMYLDMQGLDGNSAALATAFEHLVSACSTLADPVKCELVTISLLGLLVQKGVRLAEAQVTKTASGVFLAQPPAALLEILLPAVASGLAQADSSVRSISRQAFIELVQEFWFVIIFHVYQPTARWPDSWLGPLAKIATHSPVLIKERDKVEGSTAKVLLSQPISGDLKSHLTRLMPNCASRVPQLGSDQCLWLLAFHQSESMRVIGTDRFECLVQYITDDTIADLNLTDFVNDLSIGIVKAWVESKGQHNSRLLVGLTVSMVELLGSIYERIHDAGLSLLRFVLSQDEQLMGEEALWGALFRRLKLLAGLKSHEPGSRLTATVTDKEYITDAGFANRVFEDVLSFFRTVSAAAVKLSPDSWHEWVLETARELNDPCSGTDLDTLLDELLKSLLLERQHPKRSTEGVSVDGSRLFAHHLDWAMQRCALDPDRVADDVQRTDELHEAIKCAFLDLKKCFLLTDCWSSIVRRRPALLNVIIAELSDALASLFPPNQRHSSLKSVFMDKIFMGPSAELPIDPLPVKSLALVNIVSFVAVQLGRRSFHHPNSVGLFSLIGEVLLDVGRAWPVGHGRRLVVYAITEYAFKVLLQMQHRISADSPATVQFKTQLFRFLQWCYEQKVDWHVESQRVLQREVDLLKSISGLLKRAASNKMPTRHANVFEVFTVFIRHDLLRIGALLNRKQQAADDGQPDLRRLTEIAASISIPLSIQLYERVGRQSNLILLKDQLSRSLIKNPLLMFTDDSCIIVDYMLRCELDAGDDRAGKATFPPGLLQVLPPCSPLIALAIFRSATLEQSPRWLNYAMRSLETFPASLLFFYTPQITQAVRRDHLGYIETTVLHIAQTNSKLAHQIIWNMKANMFIDDLGVVPDPMKDKLEELVAKIVNGLSDQPFYRREFDFFERITSISGTLKAFVKREKSEKKRKIDEELRKIPVDAGVYLPSNPESTVLDIDYQSGRPLQSQAKAPFMATFRVQGSTADGAQEQWQSAIFKVGDDCRQDVLALQFIAAVKMILQGVGASFYLFPYRVIATAPGCGVIEVIPNSQSRDQLGREKINSLYGYFTFKFGGEQTVRFGEARAAMIRSMAAYSVICYLLAIRDRHNGNIMVDDCGHLIHIDFGFILDIAPGGIRFESAPFKFTSEMLQVLGGRESSAFLWFQELAVQMFLVVRPHCSELCRLVEQMLESGLPCFHQSSPERAIRNLRGRFKLELDDWEARQWMENLVYHSCENTRTVLYDSYQHNRNGIPY